MTRQREGRKREREQPVNRLDGYIYIYIYIYISISIYIYIDINIYIDMDRYTCM